VSADAERSKRDTVGEDVDVLNGMTGEGGAAIMGMEAERMEGEPTESPKGIVKST
jgi:hypothetical protein